MCKIIFALYVGTLLEGLRLNYFTSFRNYYVDLGIYINEPVICHWFESDLRHRLSDP